MSAIRDQISSALDALHGLSPLASSLIGLAAAVLAGLLFHTLLRRALERWGQKVHVTERRLQLQLRPLRGPLRILLPGLAVALVLPLLRLPQGVQRDLGHLVELWIIGASAWAAMRLVRIAVDMAVDYHQVEGPDNLRARQVATQLRIVGRVTSVTILGVGVAIMLMTFSDLRHIGVSLLTSAGVAGIVLGLAAQKTLGNLIAGIQIAFAQPIRLDDVVIVEGEWGRIEEITLTYVVVRIWDLRRLVVPISYFVEKPFQNWTRVSADLLGTVYVYADYTVPVSEVRAELERILGETDLWDGKIWNLQVTNATDRTVEMRALMSAPDSSTAWNLRCHVRERLLETLQRRFPDHLPRARVELKRDEPAPGEPPGGAAAG